MGKEVNNEVFEALLKAAVIQNSLNELASYPSQEEIDKLVISDVCEHKIRRTIKKHKYKDRLVKGAQITRKIVAIFAVFLGISFAVLLQFKEVRAACYEIFIQITEKFIQFDYSSGRDKEVFEVNYIPEGFREIERGDFEDESTIKYANSTGDQITFYYSIDNDTKIDNEHHLITSVKINGKEGQYFSSIDNRFENILVWHTDYGHFLIMSFLEKEEMIKIAENVK